MSVLPLGAEKLPDPATRAILAVVAFAFALCFTGLGPPAWQQSALYTFMHSVGIPLSVYGWALALVFVLLVIGSTSKYAVLRLVAFLIGAGCFSTFFLTLSFKSHLGTAGNGVTFSGLSLYGALAALYWLSAWRVSKVVT